jgi:hypothetical protein
MRISIHHTYSWSNVARGAVLCGVDAKFKNMIYTRKCRRNYGLSVSQPFSSFLHSEADAYIDPFDGTKKAKDQMVWLIKKGDAILSKEPKHASITLTRRFARRDPKIFRTLLVSYDDDNAPQRFADVSKSMSPRAHTVLADFLSRREGGHSHHL